MSEAQVYGWMRSKECHREPSDSLKQVVDPWLSWRGPLSQCPTNHSAVAGWNRASPDRYSLIDTPNNCFRISLVCTLLDAYGVLLDHDDPKINLDAFLVIVQTHILSKESIPLEVEYMIEDTFSE
ncbi:hypothetical protein B0O80DRAFT_509553 [Mortierella sp. GBAus27b]|nr:hypothetical protein B0O80DRAFT_509553 [Mortierella sp. GBAus27b]